MEALKGTGQTDAFAILQAGCAVGATTDILGRDIEMYSKNTSLKGVLSKDNEELLQLMSDPQIQTEYQKDYNIDNRPIVLCKPLPQKRPLYIPRSMSNMVKVKPDLFKLDCPDVFVFKGISQVKLKNLVKPYLTQSLRSQLKGITCRHILFDDDDDLEEWNDLLELAAEASMHLILCDRLTSDSGKSPDVYYLQRSNNVTSIVRNNIERIPPTEQNYITEGELIQELVQDGNGNVVCLCDIPGMGKSSLLKNLARELLTFELQRPDDHAIVLFIRMTSLSEHLAKVNMTEDCNPQKILLNFTTGSKLTSDLLEIIIRKQQRKLVVFFDGFEEVHHSYTDLTKDFLCRLQKSGQQSINMIISSRLHTRELLEETFGVVSYDIQPFDKVKQVKCLTEHWKRLNENTDIDRLKELAELCIEQCKKLQQNKENDILGVPLKCHILASIYEKEAKRASKGRKHESNFANMQTVGDLYETFIEVGFKRAFKTISLHANLEYYEWKRKVSLYHDLLAVELLFPHLGQSVKKLPEFCNLCTDMDEVLCVGVIVKSESGVAFVHRTFAEYIVAKRFAKAWMNSDDDFNTQEIFSRFFLETILQEYEYGIENTFDLGLLSTSYENVEIRLYKYINATILWFMDNILTKHFKLSLRNQHEVDIGLILRRFFGDKSTFTASIYTNLICCIGVNLHSLVTLLTLILNSVLEETKPCELLVTPKSTLKSPTWLNLNHLQASNAFFFYWTVMHASTAVAKHMFDVINCREKFILSTFSLLNQDHKILPIEAAIDRNDPDMVALVLDYTTVPLERLVARCLTSDHNMTEENIMSRMKIFNLITGVDENVQFDVEMVGKHMEDMINYVEFDLIVMLRFSVKFNIPFNNISQSCKALLFARGIEKYDDQMFYEILKLLLGTKLQYANNKTADHDHVHVPATCKIKAATILEGIDLKEAVETFKLLQSQSSSCFEHMRSIESLKVLLHICPSFRTSDVMERDYLHWAVLHGKIDWLQHLLQEGHNINAPDKCMASPLLYVSSQKTLEVTKCLLDNGADITIKDIHGNNFASRVIASFGNVDDQELHEWCLYTLEKGFLDLWRDASTGSPSVSLQDLMSKLGSEHKTITMICRKIDVPLQKTPS